MWPKKGIRIMQRANWRLVTVGVVLIVLAIGFFFGMEIMAIKSNDPVALMRTVGQAAGFVGGLSLAMIAVGLIGRRV